MASLADRLAALYQASAPAAPTPVRNVQSVYQAMPVAPAAARYAAPATQRNTRAGVLSAPQPRANVVNTLLTLASQRNAPLRNLGVSPAAVAPIRSPVATRIPGVSPVMAAPPRNRQSAAGQVADALLQRTQAGQQSLQNQMFDVQIQQTKDIAGPGYDNERIEDNRYDQQQAQLDAYRRRIDQVQPYVTPKGPPRQPAYNPLSSANPGTPKRPQVNADQYRYEPVNRTNGSTQAGEPTRTTPPGPTADDMTLYDLDQVQYEIARAQDAGTGDQLMPGVYLPNQARSGDLLKLRDLEEQLTRTGRMTMPGDHSGTGRRIEDAFSTVGGYNFGKPVSDAIKEYGGEAIEAFAQTPPGEAALWTLEQFNRPYEWNVTKSGDQWYDAATGNYQQGDGRVTGHLGPVGDALAMSPDTAIALTFYAAQPELREGVIAAYEQGYSSPEYIALMEESGVTDYPPQFEPGGFAVHEYLIGQTDDWPPVLRDAVRLGEGVVMDPLTYLTIVGGAGKGVRAVGKALSSADDASFGTRIAGQGLQAVGGAMEIGAKAPDMVFEAPISGFNWWRGSGKPTPGKPGALQLSPDQQAMDAQTQAAHAAGLVSRNTDTGETVLGPDQVSRDAAASQPTVPVHSTVEAEANAADGLTPQSTVARPETPAAPQGMPEGATPLSPTAYAQATGPGQVSVTNTAIPKGQPNRTIRIETKPSGVVVIHTSTGPQVAGSFDEAMSEVERIQEWMANDSVDISESAIVNEGPDAPARADGPTSTVADAGRTVEDYEVQRIADPPTSAAATEGITRPSAPARTASQIPDELPEVQAAVTRYGTTPDTTGNIPGETYFTPVYGGSRLPDAAITRAVATGDLDAMARANQLAVEVQAAIPYLTDDPWHQSWGLSGQTVDQSRILPGMTRQQADALVDFNAASGRGSNQPLAIAAGMGKAVLEKTAELEFLAGPYAEMYRAIMGENPVNTELDRLFGFTWTGAGAKGSTNRVQYLMERYVTTSSDAYAANILDWLRANTGNDILNTTNGPKPYLQGLPDQFRDEIIRRLEGARTNYRSLVNATDEDFASGAWRSNPTGKPQSAVQLGGGLKSTSKTAEKQAEKWIEADTPKRTPADEWANSPARTGRKPKNALSFAELAPEGSAVDRITDAMSKEGGWLGSKMQQAQRAADDTAVANVKNPLLARLNETAAPGFDRKTTEYLNTALPGWTPPNRIQGAWAPDEWTVFDALQWGHNEKIRNPEFDYGAFVDDIGERAAGLPSNYTPAEKKALTKIAKENGEPAPDFKALTRERTQSHKAVRVYDGYLRQIRQSSLFGPISGPAGFVGDVVGNTWAAIVNGHFGTAAAVLNPVNTGKAGRIYRNTDTLAEHVNPWEMQSAADAYQRYPRNAHAAADALLDPFLREGGQVLPHDLYPAGTLREVPVSGMPSLNEAVKQRNIVVRGLANLWTVPGIKDARTATDLVGRTTLTKRVTQKTLRNEGIPAFRKKVGELAGPANADQIMKDILAVAESRAKEAGVPWKGGFSPADVLKATEGHRHSNNMARAWQSEWNRAIDIGMAEQKRVYFSYKNTNADEAIGRVFMFHYWQTRATYMHTRAALRNPVLLNGYYKIFQELNERNEQGGMGYLGPVYKFMTSPSGIYAAFDPLGLLIPTTLIDMQDQEGNKLRVLQNQLNPVIGSLLAIAGITDNVPNVTGLRTTERWLVNMGNYLVSQGVDVASVPLIGRVWDHNTMRLSLPIDEAVKSILQEANQWWAGKGVPVGDFTPFDRGANEKDQLNTWVLKGLEEKYGPSETWQGHVDPATGAWVEHPAIVEMDAALDALTTGVPNPIADEAERQYAMEGLIAAVAAPVIPGGVITRSGYRDEQIAGNASGDPGGDLNRSLATSANPTWTVMHEQWHKIGTPEEQAVYDMYMAMTMHPETMGTVVSRTPSGKLTVLRSSQVAAMSDAEREDFINRWIAQNPGFEDAIMTVQEGRDAFKTAHPQMAEFKEYQKAVYNEQTGGVRAFRESLVKTNPNFAHELDAYRDYLKGEGITGYELERRLDSWAASPNGYLAAMGLPMQNGDKPLPVYDPSKNPYANPAMAGMAPSAGGGASGTGEGGTKPAEGEAGIYDDYWSPEKVSQRLADDVAKYDTVNQTMEQRFGDAWNAQAGEWEDHADSSSERTKLGLGGIPYEYPKESDLMIAYESWAYDNPKGTVDQWFDWLMNAPGYGAAGDPSATLNYGPKSAEATTPASSGSLGSRLDTLFNGGNPASSASSGGGWIDSVTKQGKTQEKSGTVTATSIDGYSVSQGYGMTDYAATQVGPNGIYAYTSGYTTDGSPVGHMGLDVAVPLGTPLYAPVTGYVVQAGGMPYEQDSRYGATPGTGGLRIELPNGDIVVMAHMQQIDVQVGDYVQAGQAVGYSGTASGPGTDPGSGAHVHVEYRKFAPGQSSSGYLGMNPLEMLDMGAVQ